MAAAGVYEGLLLVALIAANLPWVSERFLLLVPLQKSAWQRWLEWLLWYGICGLLAMALEYKVTGDMYTQAWEFYVATLCLFMVFALPGFIVRYEFKNRRCLRIWRLITSAFCSLALREGRGEGYKKGRYLAPAPCSRDPFNREKL